MLIVKKLKHEVIILKFFTYKLRTKIRIKEAFNVEP